MQRGQFLADLWLAADHPLLQGEGRGEDGFVPWLFNTHPHLNPPLEGEETCFRPWRKKTAYCISYAESYSKYYKTIGKI
jgi:hypothetical protein